MKNPYDPQQGQTLTDHLVELRDRLIKAAYAVAIGTVLCWLVHDKIFDIVRAPVVPFLEDGKLVFTNPMDGFVANVKLAVLGGILLACPVWLYQAWMFVAPGLYSHERKYSAMFIGSGVALFSGGVLFVYFLVLPMAFGFLLPFAGEAAKPMITISEYMSFFTTMTLVFGAAFELPLVLVLLGLIGIIDATFLRKNRRYAIMILAVVSAVITPPDALSMLMLLVPLYVLYEVSIICLVVIGKKRTAATDEGLQ